jgi:hypothetical protein
MTPSSTLSYLFIFLTAICMMAHMPYLTGVSSGIAVGPALAAPFNRLVKAIDDQERRREP